MSIRKNFDISAYLVVGRENTLGRSVAQIVEDAVRAGFTFVQIRSKECDAKYIMEDCRESARAIARLGKSESVALVVNDRLDVALACLEAGIKIDGIHVGQTDIPVSVCRKYLGENAIVGLSARTDHLIDYVKSAGTEGIDYFGAGPLHETATKPDCGRGENGIVVTRSLEELSELHRISPLPVVVGGGVKKADIPALKGTGVEGFFVVSAVAGAEDPYTAAKALTEAWQNS